MEILTEEPEFHGNVEAVSNAWLNAYPGDSPSNFMYRKNDEGIEYYNAQRGDFLIHFAGVSDKEKLIVDWADALGRHQGPWHPEELLRNITGDIAGLWLQKGYCG